MRIAAITGFSGVGKTTLIVALIRRYLDAGQRVAAIKHTHHKLNAEHRGDTALFLDAGAEPVIFAGNGRAVIFRRDAEPEWISYASPDELAAIASADIVLVEGFRSHAAWPQISIDAEQRPSVDELAGNLDRIWSP